jgi:hypothetical protein
MSKARSPSYPAISLKEAVERVNQIYERDYQNPIPKAVAASHMGYGGLNGKSLGVLAALSKYGLLEGRGNDSRVTDLAVKIIAHPHGTSERAQAIQEAAAKPELFNELDGRFQSGKASDQAIRSYLLTQKFIPAGADALIRSYRETKQLVDAESAGYSSHELPEAKPMMSSDARSALAPSPPPPFATAHNQTFTAGLLVERGVNQTSLSLKDDERVEVQAVLYDQEAVQKLIDKLSAIKGLLPEKVIPPPPY